MRKEEEEGEEEEGEEEEEEEREVRRLGHAGVVMACGRRRPGRNSS